MLFVRSSLTTWRSCPAQRGFHGVHHLSSQRGSLRCRANGPLDDVEAYAEAQEIYVQAQKLSTLQTRYEMEMTWADIASSESTPQQGRPPSAPSDKAIIAFLMEQGLSSFEALGLHKELYLKAGSTRQQLSLEQLSAKIQRWQRVLPDVNIARLAVNDPDIFYADISTGLRAVIVLVEVMPGRDVMSMVSKQPKLLWQEDLAGRLGRAIALLIKLHPSRDEDVVKDMIAEHPELIWRMEYYTKATMIDDLPIEIQNMMVVADQSIGYTFRYYRNRRTNYQAELSSSEPFEQQT